MKEEGQFGAAPPGTIIRCRGTLKYPACPIGRRSPVTPLRYAQELYAATLCCFADPLQAFSSRALFSLSLCASSLFLSTLFSFFFSFLFFYHGTSATTQRRVARVAFRPVPKESRTRFHVNAHRKQLNWRLNGPSIEDIKVLGSDYEDTRYVG